MEKEKSNKKLVFCDLDGVMADFDKGYKEAFGRDASKNDQFTTQSFCMQVPHFFEILPVNEKGLQLFNMLKDKYRIAFLTTPMKGMSRCKIDKIEWVKEHFGEYPVIFSENKADFVVDETSILIDDMDYNIEPWNNAGGTAIDFINTKNDKILEKIEIALGLKEHIKSLEEQIKNIAVNLKPTLKQKESGIYKKGKINFKGLDIRIENPKGSIRWGLGENGKKWINKLSSHYGYIANGQDGADGDKIDCFIGPHLNKSLVFVINQGFDGMFDEHKILLGFDSIEEAEKAYLSSYQKGWNGLQSIRQTNTKKLREWLKNGNTLEPFE